MHYVIVRKITDSIYLIVFFMPKNRFDRELRAINPIETCCSILKSNRIRAPVLWLNSF